MNNELTLSILDDIDESTSDSELYVIESYMDMLDKDIMIFTESSKKKKDEDMGVGDRMKEYSKNDSNKFVTAIAFIPRLIAALAKTITSKLAKSGIGKAFKSISDYFKGVKEEKEKRQRVEDLNEKLKPYGFEFYYDEVKDKIRLKKSAARVLALIGWLNAMVLGTYSLVKKFKKSIDNKDDNAIVRLKDDFKKLLSKAENKEKVDPHDMIDDTIDSISIALNSILSVGAELALLGVGIGGLTGYASKVALTKDDPEKASKDSKMYNDIAQTTSYLTKIVGIITAAVGSLTVITKWGEIVKDISHAKKDAKEDRELIETRLKKKGYIKANMSFDEWNKLYEKEPASYKEDYEEAKKRVLQDKGKDINDPKAKDYLSEGEINDKMDEILEEFRQKNNPNSKVNESEDK